MHVSSESIGETKLSISYKGGREQIIPLVAADIGKALEIGLLAFLATGGAPSAEIPVGLRVKNLITPATIAAGGPVVKNQKVTVVAAGPIDYTSIGGPAAGVTGDVFVVSVTGVVPAGGSVRGRIDYSALNANANQALVDLNEEFNVLIPNRVFAAGSQASFSLVGVDPSIILV